MSASGVTARPVPPPEHAPAAAPPGFGSRPLMMVLVALLLSSASDVMTTLFEKVRSTASCVAGQPFSRTRAQRSVGDTVSLGGRTHVSFCTS